MKNKIFMALLGVITIILLTGIGTLLSMPATAVQPTLAAPMASSESYQLNWDVVSNGGSTMQSTSFNMYSTTGQNVTATMSSSSYTMKNGFWQGVFENIYELFLPIITRA